MAKRMLSKERTIKERIIIGLQLRGWSETGKTRTYKVFTHTESPDRKVFVGKCGALRGGPNVRDSICYDITRKRILEEISA